VNGHLVTCSTSKNRFRVKKTQKKTATPTSHRISYKTQRSFALLNAVVESFFGTLKSERVYWQDYQTRQQARNDIVDYIAMFNNPLRLHSYLDYKSPDQYEWTIQWAKVV
jgi:transposase InsO family protein